RLLGSTTFLPPNSTAFTIIDKQSPGTIAGTFGNAPNGGQVNIGGRVYTANYNTAAFGSGANDLVLVAAPRTFVWDGGSATSDNWTDAANWVGDDINDRPIAGDNLVFNDVGVTARNTPFNDFSPGTNFGLLTL